jgi:HTH-type transcriptional regulator/antitoxin HigA
MPTITGSTGKGVERMVSPKSKAGSSKALDGYLELIHAFPLRPIRSERELDRAIYVINALLDRGRLTSAEEDYLEVLSDLVERYEDRHHQRPTADLSDAEMLGHLLEAKEVTQAEVARATGMRESRISEVLSGKRTLTRTQIGKLAAYFRVSPAVFLPTDQSGSHKGWE